MSTPDERLTEKVDFLHRKMIEARPEARMEFRLSHTIAFCTRELIAQLADVAKAIREDHDGTQD